jgi:putative transposase
VLKQAEVGVPVVELIRKVGISEQTFYRWKAKYVGLEVDQVRQMKQLQEENLRLKQLVAELTLDKAMAGKGVKRIPPSPPASQSTGFTKYFATVCPTRHNRLVFPVLTVVGEQGNREWQTESRGSASE